MVERKAAHLGIELRTLRSGHGTLTTRIRGATYHKSQKKDVHGETTRAKKGTWIFVGFLNLEVVLY